MHGNVKNNLLVNTTPAVKKSLMEGKANNDELFIMLDAYFKTSHAFLMLLTCITASENKSTLLSGVGSTRDFLCHKKVMH